jgi:hypothetical protein
MSVLKVDTINEKTSGNGVAIPGHVIQTIFDDPTSAFSSANGNTQVATTSTSYVNTGVKITITPKFSSSLVLLNASIHMATPVNEYSYITVKRVISGGATTDLGHVHSDGRNFGVIAKGAGNAYGWDNVPICFPDKPNTTSSIEYQLWWRNNSTSGTTYVGWTSASNGTFPHNLNFVNVMEIAQ